MAKEVKSKKRCCKSSPRCKRCPTVLRRLEKSGRAKRLSKRRYLVAGKVPKKALRKTRSR